MEREQERDRERFPLSIRRCWPRPTVTMNMAHYVPNN